MAPVQTRVYVLARELKVDAKDLVATCRRLGIDVKNQLSNLSYGQRMHVEDVVRAGSCLEVVPPSTAPPLATSPPVQTPAFSTLAEAVSPVHIRSQSHYSPEENPGIERLLGIGEKAGFEKLGKIASVATIDPECAMFKIRKLTERLSHVILKAKRPDNLNDAITEIGTKKLLGKKTIAYLHQVRTLSNVAVHVSDDLFDEDFSIQDVNNAAEALACVIDEALARSLIQAK